MPLRTVTVGSIVQERKIPTANIVADPAFGVVGSVVRIDGRGSTDPTDNPLSYNWTFLSVPIGSKVGSEGFRTLDEVGGLVSFSPDIVGEYIVGLIVNNGIFDSDQVSTEVSIRAIMVPHGRGIVPDGKFIWSYIRDVWKEVENREWFETFWSALIQIVGAELLKLYQVDFNKSIRDIQDKFQRRWLKYEPELDLTTSDLSFFLGSQSAGLNASTERLGSTGKGVIVGSNEFIVTDGTVLQDVVGDDLDILFSSDSSNIGAYPITGNNADLSGYKTLDTFPNPIADRVATNIAFYFDFQSTVWNLSPARGYAVAISEHSSTLEELAHIFASVSGTPAFNNLHVGDIILYRSGPNAGHYRVVSISGSFIVVDHAPPSFSDIVTSGTYVADVYHPITYGIDLPVESTSITFSLPFNSSDPNDLSLIAPGRVVVVGGQTFTIVRSSVDSNRSIPLTVVTVDGEFVAGKTSLPWRLPNTLVSKSQDFELLGVSSGDLLSIEIEEVGQTTTSTIVSQVVGVDGFRLGFVLTDERLEPGQVPAIPNKTFLQVANDLGIKTISQNPDGSLSFSDEAEELFNIMNSLFFHRQYWDVEFNTSTSFRVGSRTFNIVPKSIIRNKLIPVDDTLLSVPLLQNYIGDMNISTHDDKFFVVRNEQEYEVAPPISLIENNDFIVDGEFAYSGRMVFDTGTDIISTDDADFIDRGILPGDEFIIDGPITIAGTYLIQAILDRNKIRLQRTIPKYVLGDPVNAKIRIKRQNPDHFIRLIPGLFTPKNPAPPRFWAEASFFDNSPSVEANFGILVGLTQEQLQSVTTNVSYRQAVSGLMYAFTQGSAVDKVRLGAQILLGLPFAEHKGIIRSIESDYRLDAMNNPILGRFLIEDIDGNGEAQGIQRIYTYPIDLISELAGIEINPATGNAYKVGDVVEVFAPLCKGVSVDDYISKPLGSEASGKQMLQQFHSIDVRANDNIFGPAEFDLISGFLKKITPSYIAFVITILSEFEDDVVVTDNISIGVAGTVADNASFSIPPAIMLDSRTLSSIPQAAIDDGFYWVRRSGKDLHLVGGTTGATLTAGGIVSPRTNESFEAPLTRTGDILWVLSGLNSGKYPITAVVDDQHITVSGLPSLGFVEDTNVRYGILRSISPLIRTGTASTTSGSRIITVESSLRTDGVSPIDWLTMNGQRYKITRVGPCPAFHDPFGVFSDEGALLTGQLELDRTVGSTSSFSYRVYRNSLIESPHSEALNVTGNGTNIVSNDNQNIWMLLEPGDEIQLQNSSLDRLIVLDPVNGYVTPTLATGTTAAKICKKGHSSGIISWDQLRVDPGEQMDVFLSSTSSTDASTGSAMSLVILTSLPNPSASGILPGDRLQLIGGSGDAVIDIGYGAGIYPIAQVSGTNIHLTVNLTTTSTYAWKIIRRRT